MFIAETKIRVRYSETDQMSYVYYGNYAQYYEVARVEALRSIGTSYKELENAGFMMPVIQMNINYKMPALYDEELKLVTYIKKLPTVKMEFHYEIYNTDNMLINSAITTLVFVHKETRKPCRCPKWFSDLFKNLILTD